MSLNDNTNSSASQKWWIEELKLYFKKRKEERKICVDDTETC